MKTSRKFVLFGAALAFLLGIAGTLRAQTATGEITGTVTDTSGAVVPQVKVTVTNQQTNSTRETMTNDAGAYTVTLLPVGVYTISAQKTGFRIAKQTDITLNVAQTIRTCVHRPAQAIRNG